MGKRITYFLMFLAFSQLGFTQNATLVSKETLTEVSSYPNPFSLNTEITFHSPEDQPIIFLVKNLLGKTVFKSKILAEKGKNTFPFQRNSLDIGMYIYILQTPNERVTKRLVIR